MPNMPHRLHSLTFRVLSTEGITNFNFHPGFISVHGKWVLSKGVKSRSHGSINRALANNMELNSDCHTSRVLRLAADSTMCMCYVLKTQITPFWHENPFIILIFQQMFRLIDVRLIRVPRTISAIQHKYSYCCRQCCYYLLLSNAFGIIQQKLHVSHSAGYVFVRF